MKRKADTAPRKSRLNNLFNKAAGSGNPLKRMAGLYVAGADTWLYGTADEWKYHISTLWDVGESRQKEEPERESQASGSISDIVSDLEEMYPKTQPSRAARSEQQDTGYGFFPKAAYAAGVATGFALETLVGLGLKAVIGPLYTADMVWRLSRAAFGYFTSDSDSLAGKIADAAPTGLIGMGRGIKMKLAGE